MVLESTKQKHKLTVINNISHACIPKNRVVALQSKAVINCFKIKNISSIY